MIKLNDKFVDVFRVMAEELTPDVPANDDNVKIIIETLIHGAAIKVITHSDCPRTKAAILDFLANNDDFSGLIVVDEGNTEENKKS